MLLLEPKLSNIWNDAYPVVPVEYTAYTNNRSTKKATLTDAQMTGLGALRLKGEGENIVFDDIIMGDTVAYTPVRFALGYKITQEVIDHELYGQVEKIESGLVKSAVDLQETIAALAINNGFVTTAADGFSATGFDGLALFSTAHTRLDGGAVFRNRPTTDVDLGVTALQNALIDIENTKDDRGRPINLRAQLLIISPEDRFTAEEILQSELKPGTANNDINALKGKLSFMVSHYKTDTDAWAIKCDRHDVNFVWDTKPRGGMQEDFEAEVIKRKIVEGFAVGHGEARGWYGSTGV
jgi:hypothetical protein